MPTAVYAALFVLGMSYFALFGLIAAYTAKMFPPEIASVLSGSIFVAVGLGSMIGNYASGQIIEATRAYGPVYLGMATVVVLLALISLCMTSDRPALLAEA
jgi:predicted MFS family arabinose efflux permease